MGYKTLIFSNPCSLAVKNFQLVIQQEEYEDKITVPLEDISTIILENPSIKLSNYLLSMCGEYNITLFTCDKKHKPNGILIPFYQHSRSTKISKIQINISEPLKNRIWQKLIKQKITNQSNVLKICMNTDILDNFIDKVQSGDKTNIEGQAAKYYWGLLFKNFKRHTSSSHNSALDYGYAIIRGTLAKYVASSGLIPSFGVHHCNELNAFNLVEDLIEPFRPFVDLVVSEMKLEDDYVLSKQDKLNLLSILNKQCQFKNESVSVQNACENICKSFVKCIEMNDYKLLELPKFIEVK